MSEVGKGKRGAAGAANAKNIPFRYHGGTVAHPAHNPVTRNADKHAAGPSSDKSKHITGLIGGVVFARMGYRFAGDVNFDPSLKG